MKILLVGGSSSFMNNMIVKFRKEGHKVYLLTGNRYKKEYYQKVFERYDFPYDCQNLDDILETVRPDVMIYTGIYDSHYRWRDAENDAVRYLNGLESLLMGFRNRKRGTFVYISSEVVYEGNYEGRIAENVVQNAVSTKGLAAYQAENLVRSYNTNGNVDTAILRIGSMFSIPESSSDMSCLSNRLAYEAITRRSMSIKENIIAPIFESDAISRIYTFVSEPTHLESEYNISGNKAMSEEEVAMMVNEVLNLKAGIIKLESPHQQIILNSERFDSEFGTSFYCELDAVLKRSIEQVNKNKFTDRSVEDKKEKRKDKTNNVARLIVPFVENLVAFLLVFALSWFTRDMMFFQKIDFYLIYVLIFAMIYGQNQAIFSGVLSMVGYYLVESQIRSGNYIVMDATTYIWIAEVFVLGMSVGYLHDNIEKIKKEKEAESVFYDMQLSDMKDINTSNVRVKDALETQIVNQSNSVGKIYSITSSLNQYSPQEVLFYAAEMIGKLCKSKDVAIYNVVNSDYARLFSFTSAKAKVLGNSIKYTELDEIYNVIKEKKVFINRKMDERYPFMASAVFDDEGNMQLIIMIFTMSWENMTLGQANQLVVIGALIQNAVVRSTRYLDALQETRFRKNTRALEPQAFNELKEAYLTASGKGLTECILVKCNPNGKDVTELVNQLSRMLRQTDYMGILEDGVYILFANTGMNDSVFVTNRLLNAGIDCEVIE